MFSMCLLPISVFFKDSFLKSFRHLYLKNIMLFCFLKHSVKLNNCQNCLLKTIPGIFPSIFSNPTRCIETEMQSYFSTSAVRMENWKWSWSSKTLDTSLLTPLFFISLPTSLDSSSKLVLLSFKYSSALCRGKCHSFLYLVICLGPSLYVFFSITWVQQEGTLVLLTQEKTWSETTV